ncbi:MAG TPA: hypothetical protein VM737_10580 [Gemmatimonadota bacterium]|nr:hypothetical protein [Gemmatimonadota bacterium]
MVRAHAPLAFTAVLLWACAEGGESPVESRASGPAPEIRLTLGFGHAPVAGTIFLTPAQDTRNWRYAVDLDADGAPEHEGLLTRQIGFHYNYGSPGVHRILITLNGPEGEVRHERPVVVIDPGSVRILAQRDVGMDDEGPFEGIAIDHRGESLYVSSYGGGPLLRLDPSDLSIEGRLPLNYSAEGLSVTPSDSLLFITYKYRHLAVVAIPSLEMRRFLERSETGAFFIQALNDREALVSGRNPFTLLDAETGLAVRRVDFSSEVFPNWHFSLSPDGETVAVLDRSGPPSVFLLHTSTLGLRRVIPLPGVDYATHISFHPSGDRVYVLGFKDAEARFLALDATDGEVLEDIGLGPVSCWHYCVANPVATGSDGRFVVFALEEAAFFVATDSDLPRHRLDWSGSGVVASPAESAFFFVRSDGVVTKATID